MPRKHRWPDPQIDEPDDKRIDREGKRVIAAHVDYETVVALRHLKSDSDLTTDAVVHEGLAFVFISRGIPLPRSLIKKLRAIRARSKRGSGD